jgi:hypothetical protein
MSFASEEDADITYLIFWTYTLKRIYDDLHADLQPKKYPSQFQKLSLGALLVLATHRRCLTHSFTMSIASGMKHRIHPFTSRWLCEQRETGFLEHSRGGAHD